MATIGTSQSAKKPAQCKRASHACRCGSRDDTDFERLRARRSLIVGRTFYPLKSFVWDRCWLVQLQDFETPETHFHGEYVYFFSWLAHARNYVDMSLLPGTRIPVMAPGEIERQRPDYVLILPWNLRDEIIAQIRQIPGWGGRFIVPIPEPTLLDSRGNPDRRGV